MNEMDEFIDALLTAVAASPLAAVLTPVISSARTVVLTKRRARLDQMEAAMTKAERKINQTLTDAGL